MSALSDAITQSFTAREPERPALSPLRALGRRRLSGIEVLAQSVATTAPAASMVVLTTAIVAGQSMLAGLLTVAATTVLLGAVAACFAAFTRRLAAAGGPYTFVAQGLGPRAALGGGAALAVKYLGSAGLTLYHGGQSILAVAHGAGVSVPALPLYLVLACVIGACLVRGIRFAVHAILLVEACSLAFILTLFLVPAVPTPVAEPPGGGAGELVVLALTAVFALAGFESATFLAPEARRPLVTVTRTVLWTPVICGALCVLAALAVWGGRGGTVIDAYRHGTDSGVPVVVVVALHLGLTCSWLASSMASVNAVSRLGYTMGIERVLPRPLAAVHRMYRTPYRAVAAAGLVALTIAVAKAGAPHLVAGLQHAVRVAVLVAYVLVAVASLRFLTRIGEHTRGSTLVGGAAAAGGALLLGCVVGSGIVAVDPAVVAVPLLLLAAGPLWYLLLRRRTPRAATAIGVFDSAESADVLPGAGVFAPDRLGAMTLVRADRGPHRDL
ncbi:APC family permease [Rhodococcus aetherivorans]